MPPRDGRSQQPPKLEVQRTSEHWIKIAGGAPVRQRGRRALRERPGGRRAAGTSRASRSRPVGPGAERRAARVDDQSAVPGPRPSGVRRGCRAGREPVRRGSPFSRRAMPGRPSGHRLARLPLGARPSASSTTWPPGRPRRSPSRPRRNGSTPSILVVTGLSGSSPNLAARRAEVLPMDRGDVLALARAGLPPLTARWTDSSVARVVCWIACGRRRRCTRWRIRLAITRATARR